MKPYYQDDFATVYHGDCRDILAGLRADCVITDPPYNEKTHQGARTLSDSGEVCELVNFAHTEPDELRRVFSQCIATGPRWVIATLAYQHAIELEVSPPEGLRFVRLGVWVKTNSCPQFTGDRPSQGWEAIAYMHRLGGRMQWNGGGRTGNFVSTKDRSGLHPTAKPLDLIQHLVGLFSNRGETVLDPFMGAATTLVAAKNLGRKSIGIESNEAHCETAANRLSQETLGLGDVA